MIARIWHGYTTFANADIYEKLLKEEVFTSIEEKQVKTSCVKVSEPIAHLLLQKNTNRKFNLFLPYNKPRKCKVITQTLFFVLNNNW